MSNLHLTASVILDRNICFIRRRRLLISPFSWHFHIWIRPNVVDTAFLNVSIFAVNCGCSVWIPCHKHFWKSANNNTNAEIPCQPFRRLFVLIRQMNSVDTKQHFLKLIIESKRVTLYPVFWSYPLYSLFWLLIIPYWVYTVHLCVLLFLCHLSHLLWWKADFHFYWAHRACHPWKKFGKWDLGKIIYRKFHYWHHIDHNPGPWSALNANPIENWFMFTAFFFPFLFIAQHPYHIHFNKFFSILSTFPNHDGFDSPGGGSYYHYLHHAHFDCNYGSPMVPFDHWFGTYSDGTKYKKKKWFVAPTYKSSNIN